MRIQSIGLGVVVLIGLGIAYLKWPRAATAKVEVKVLPTAAVRIADFEVTLRVPGILEASKSYPIMNMAPQAQVIWIAEEGAIVKSGDVVVKLNATELNKQLTEQEKQATAATLQEQNRIEDARRRVQTATVALEKMKSDIILTQSQGEASVERAQASLDFAKEAFEVTKKNHERNQRLANQHLLPLAQLEDSADQVRREEFGLRTSVQALEKAKEDQVVNKKNKEIELHKAETEMEDSQTGLQRTLTEIAREQEDRNRRLTELREQVAQSNITTKWDGMVLLDMNWDEYGGHKFRVGDQVWEGQKIGSLIDPGNMLVRCEVGEGDIGRIQMGQFGRVTVEAVENAVLKGKVTTIDNVSHDRRFWEGGTPGKRVFTVTLQLEDRNTKLRPGMSGTVEIVLEKANNELTVPADAIFRDKQGEVVYCQKGEAYTCVPVKVLRRSEMMASVKGQLRTGDLVTRQQPPASQIRPAKERKP